MITVTLTHDEWCGLISASDSLCRSSISKKKQKKSLRDLTDKIYIQVSTARTTNAIK
jgi:hypothetical protein